MAAAAYYHNEEAEAWKCPKHPLPKRRRNKKNHTNNNGICPTCLHDRLVTLCPSCANPRPCSCPNAMSSSSSSPSSSDQPYFRRSRSVAVVSNLVRSPSTLLSSIFKRSNTKRNNEDLHGNNIVDNGVNNENNKIEDFAKMISRSRSVSTMGGNRMMASGYRDDDVGLQGRKGKKFWKIPSPMKAFRSSKAQKIVVNLDRSPLHRG